MKHLKLFFALFAMLALGVGNAWGAEVTETIKMKGFAGITSQGYQNVTKTGSSDKGTTMVAYAYDGKSGQVRGNKTTVAGASVTNEDNSKNWSLYNSQAMGGAIKSITITQTATGSNKFQNEMYVSLGTTTQGAVTTITNAQKHTSLNANTITFDIDPSKGYTYFKLLSTKKFGTGTLAGVEVKVTYETASGGGETPVASLSATPTIDFGTVYQGATVTDKTVTVNFENLTGAVTYSGLSTPFTATGAISATGDKITISADATTIGAYSQTLTIASTVDSKTAKVTVTMNVVEKPAPTGTFTLHTGALVEGDYVIYYNGKAMKAAVSSERLGYEEVTPSGNEIVDPLAATIWHIAPSGSNWTIYNDNKGYAAGNGTANKAVLVADLTGDNAKKAAWTVTGTSTYDFVNVWNDEKDVNKTLRNNGTYGFACYATATGGALSLYRKAGEKYDVTVNSTTNGTVTADPTSAEAGATIALTVTPDAGYVLDALTVTDASSNPVTVTDNKFTMPASDVTVTATFKENEKPAATLTLSKNGVTEDITGNKQDDVVTLPTTVDTDCVKEFVGWSADANCATEPEYAPGASYTLAYTSQTLYAVYATAQGGGEVTSEDLFENNSTYNATNPATIDWTLSNVVSILQEQGTSTSAVNSSYDKDPRWYKSHVITITPSVNITKIVTKAQSEEYATALANSTYTNATATVNGDIVTITPTSANEVVTIKMGAQARLYTLTVTYASAPTYSNYSTTCAAALANPTFSLAEGKYTEAKSVEIEYTEGTVYYTMDGTDPTASSTQYTAAIALNDCGEYTIKAIAISSDSQSDVVSATYTIKLPLTNSQAAPYTEAEAIAVYDGDCYDNQDVYVKGTVKTATFNSTYGNYTITLTNGFQFYRFLQAAETKFTEDIIVPGDVLVACGKLSKYQTTYQLAEGCYLVERIPYEGEKTDISNTEATAYTVDKAFELIADVSSDLTKEVYVKGFVAVAPTSNPTDAGKMTYSISDDGEKTGKVLKVYLGLGIDGAKFTSKDDVKQGDYVVAKGKLLDYSGTYELTDNQLVQHVKAATISIADITMEVGETKTIAATITPAAAETKVAYSIKAGSDDCITLSENNITAKAEGTATIVATIATAEGEYMGKTVDFTVTVTPESTSDEVVILAELDGKWYAMKGAVPTGKSNQLDALEVTYFNGTLYNVAESDKASITWTRSIVDGKATFVNNGKYLKGDTDSDLTLSASVDDKCKWMWDDENGYYTTNSSGTIRTFLYRENFNFKNYAVSEAGNDHKDGNYSSLPVVTAPVYATGDITYTRNVTNKYGTICLPYASASTTGAYFYRVAGKEEGSKVYLESVDALEAGVPYIFEATAGTITVTCQGEAVDAPQNDDANGLIGTFTNETEVPDGMYILYQGAFCTSDNPANPNKVNAYRAYLDMNAVRGDAPQQMPGRRYIGMDVEGENEATGFENITNGENTTIKVIENGQLIIIRGGEKFNAQGQKL